MNAMQKKLNTNFRNSLVSFLESDGISEKQEDRILELLCATEKRCYTSAEYQEVLRIKTDVRNKRMGK